MTIYDAIAQRFFNVGLHFLIPLARSIIRLFLLPLKLLPINSEQLGPPRNYIEKTADWIKKTNYQNSNYIEIHQPEYFRNPPPVCIDQTVHWKFRQVYDYNYPSTFVAQIPHGRAVGCNTTIIAPGDILLGDISTRFGVATKHHPVLCLLKLPKCKHVNASVCVLLSQGHENYYHWMYDILPMFELLKLSGLSAELFLVDAIQPFQLESLQMLGIKKEQIIQCRKNMHIKARTMIIPFMRGHCSKWSYEFLRRSFPPDAAKNANSHRRIYITRAGNKRRRVINESDVENTLKARGFHTISCDNLSFQEQISIFSGAEAVIAPHGAALSNLVFCKPGTRVFELFSPQYVNVCYWAVCAHAELKYHYLLGEGRQPKEFTDPHLLFSDILVDTGKLSRLLDMAEIN